MKKNKITLKVNYDVWKTDKGLYPIIKKEKSKGKTKWK